MINTSLYLALMFSEMVRFYLFQAHPLAITLVLPEPVKVSFWKQVMYPGRQ